MIKKTKRFRIYLFPYAIIGSLLGGAFAGLFEGIAKTLYSGYGSWTLPVTAVGYYAFLGIITGIGIGALIILLLMTVSGKLTKERVFSISASTTAFYLFFYYFNNRIFNFFGITLTTIITISNFTVVSLIYIVFFWILFYLFHLLIMGIYGKTGQPLLKIMLIYFILLSVTGIIAIVSPENKYEYKSYNSDWISKISDKPNVLFILVDALRYDWISPYGFDIETPAMASIAKDGMKFTNTIANCNWTKPAVASIFTSRLPKGHGIYTKLPDNLPLLADEMSNAGYYSIGFSTNPHIQQLTGFHRGFNDFYSLNGVEVMPLDMEAPTLAFNRHIRTIIRNLIPPLKKKEITYCDAEKTTNRVIKWLKSNNDKKFFMYLHYMDPHPRFYIHPFNGEYANPVDDPGGENFEFYTSAYQGEIIYTDHHLSRLLKYLKDAGLYDSMLIIFTADHGQEMFDHYFWGHGSSMYKEQIQIPLIIKFPENHYAGTTNELLVSQIDYAPTIINIAGHPRPDGWDGHNIFSEDFFNDCVISQSSAINCNIVSYQTLRSKWVETDPGYSSVRSGQSRFVTIDP
ncbi:MAG: sulfatase, partial [candidate division Zixibacteria bacterium]|nr:sulfatase [candidate division Zixibacteria bacterium]